MAIKLVMLFVAAVAVSPAVATLAGKSQKPAPSLTRQVDLSGPIHSFTQTQDRIQVRLTPARGEEKAARTRLIVRTGGAHAAPEPVIREIAVPIRPGQTWLSAELPAAIARAETISVSVE
jgi:hypothetical protein